jgi:anti-anti-sigma factor
MQFLFTFQSVWGEAGIHSLMATRDAAAGQSDIFDFGNDFIMNPQDVPGTRAKFEALLRRCGLKAERIGLGDHMPELTAYQRLTPDQVAAFKAAMHNVNYWRITVASGHADDEGVQPSTHKRPFYMGCDVQEGTFHATVEGRLDTISSPELLKEWERVSATEKIAGVQIDCSKLQYVSSAGLRVFMIMQKALPGSQVKLIGVNSDIQEILDTTGFSAIFDVRP